MHRAQQFINNLPIPVASTSFSTRGYGLTVLEADLLLKYLKIDATDCLYSSTISIGDAVRGINRSLFTWATVKLYYATFYALRSLLALDGICIFYEGNKPFIVEAKAGSLPVKNKNGQTHKVVISEFRARNSGHYLLSQDIEGSDPLEWLTDKREDANYKSARFCEPMVPDHFKLIVGNGIRRCINAYMQDQKSMYLFDRDHAILAYPLSTLKMIYQKCRLHKIVVNTNQEIIFINNIFSDSQGPMPEVCKLVK